MRAALLLLFLSCKSAPPALEASRLLVFGEIHHLCTSGVTPAGKLQVDLRDREDPQLLGTTFTSSTGHES